MASFVNFKIKWETRLCRVYDRIGYFHTWEQYSNGELSEVFGIVEFANGIERVCPCDIDFCDETHAELVSFVNYIEELEEKKNESISE